MAISIPLSPLKISNTAMALRKRISERFPTSGLLITCDDLIGLSQQISVTAEWLSRPIWPLRTAVAVIIGLIFGLTIAILRDVVLPTGALPLLDFVQVIEASASNAFFFGTALFFLINWETRIKRGRALKALHELRSLAHIIDMHQLTKDPARVVGHTLNTASSPTTNLNQFELGRYLDYCSEMLSLTGKIAALYSEHLNDPVVLVTVNEIEDLTTSLSRKIWQKIMIVHAIPVRA